MTERPEPTVLSGVGGHMFTSIATAPKLTTGRDTLSLALSAAVLGGAIALAFRVHGPVKALVLASEPLPAFVEISMPPAPGPIAPAAKARGPTASENKGITERTDEVVAQPVAPLLNDLPAAASLAPQSGGGNAEVPGEGGGVADVPGGGGPSSGGTGSGARAVHFSELQPKVRVQPRFPEAARTIGRREEECVLRIVVNEAGEPETVVPRQCPALYQAAALEAANQWRWYPLLDNGSPIRAQFDLKFVFRLRD